MTLGDIIRREVDKMYLILVVLNFQKYEMFQNQKTLKTKNLTF